MAETQKTQEKKVEPGQNRKDWRTPWRIISIAFTSPQRKDLLGQCCPVNKAPCIAWRKATPRCKPDEIMKKCMNTYKYPAICSFGTLKIKGCRFVTPLKGCRFETRLVVLVYIYISIYYIFIYLYIYMYMMSFLYETTLFLASRRRPQKGFSPLGCFDTWIRKSFS